MFLGPAGSSLSFNASGSPAPNLRGMRTRTLLSVACALFYGMGQAQQDSTYRLRLEVPLIDLPQNTTLPYRIPGMEQASAWSTGLYQLGYWGIDAGVDALMPSPSNATFGKRLLNGSVKYLAGLGFACYGSELPIPLGVWAHEEFHRSVLGVNNIAALNGNWIGSRWDGTVYGVTDQQLTDLKARDLNNLLYSYLAGVHAEILSNERITKDAFNHSRNVSMAPLLLYNSWYVWNYFNFSTSAASDSVVVLAPPHESADPAQRDFAGADLTAWAYDMYLPNEPYTARAPFPNGEGVNRRIGYSELPADAQQFLKEQRGLTWMNFANPAVLGIDRIRFGGDFAFNVFLQYAPTHFGHMRAVHMPFRIGRKHFHIGAQEFVGLHTKGMGLRLEHSGFRLTPLTTLDVGVALWDQPKSFTATERMVGGSSRATIGHRINEHFTLTATAQAKTDGWMLGDPYLKANATFRLGFVLSL